MEDSIPQIPFSGLKQLGGNMRTANKILSCSRAISWSTVRRSESNEFLSYWQIRKKKKRNKEKGKWYRVKGSYIWPRCIRGKCSVWFSQLPGQLQLDNWLPTMHRVLQPPNELLLVRKPSWFSLSPRRLSVAVVAHVNRVANGEEFVRYLYSEANRLLGEIFIWYLWLIYNCLI